MTWPAIKRNFTQASFADYVKTLIWNAWRPSAIVWHNTAAPSLAQWIKSAQEDIRNGYIPGTTRIRNLEAFFRENNHWSGCPHLFIANDFIWVMNPLTGPGVHSPSWNHISIGIEMIGDFSIEDDDTGEGLAVKSNTIFATAILCSTLGINPSNRIWLHKEDPKTTHDCPGQDVARDKNEMIRDVASLMTGGEHSPEDVARVIAGGSASTPVRERRGITTVSGLNFRIGPGVTSPARSELPKDVSLTILDEAANGTSSWLKVKTPAGYVGWVAGKFVKEIK